MCSICRQYPCDSRCPNAPAPKAVYKCAYCGEGITHGEKYLEYDGEYYHLECVESMTASEIVETFGFQVETADEDDICYLYESEDY